VKSNGRRSAKRLAKDLGVSPTIISEILNNPNRETKMNTCAKIINYLREEIDISTLSAIETDGIENSPIDIAHRNIIQRFENKEFAKEINVKLLELEGYDSALLLKANAYIDGLLDAVRPMKNGTNGLD
jgi:transcriptional regulator with XRE-family HTH domain